MSGPRQLVGSHYGWGDFLIQRMSGLVIVVFTVWLLVELLLIPELTYGNWAGLFATTRMKIVTTVAAAALCYHAWLGAREILMDYIKPDLLRLLLQAVCVVASVGYVVWAATILWRV